MLWAAAELKSRLRATCVEPVAQVVALFRRSIEANGFSELVAPASDAEVSTDERASEGSGGQEDSLIANLAKKRDDPFVPDRRHLSVVETENTPIDPQHPLTGESFNDRFAEAVSHLDFWKSPGSDGFLHSANSMGDFLAKDYDNGVSVVPHQAARDRRHEDRPVKTANSSSSD
ncbi:unnamed protein product [Durusdinium trenchii]|uniref:Uncharacterized protein n=1 Tax=Durusdinium trenchii TaxID=1381693 RepID=A0ABP0SVC7_9DINO